MDVGGFENLSMAKNEPQSFHGSFPPVAHFTPEANGRAGGVPFREGCEGGAWPTIQPSGFGIQGQPILLENPREQQDPREA